MRGILISLFCLILPCASIGGWDWPVEGGHVVTDIGPTPGGDTLPGMVIGGVDGFVEAAADGEVVLTIDPDQCAYCLPSVLGAVAVLHHARGFRSTYGYLEGIRGIEGRIVRGTVLGRVGQSGDALGPRLYFQVTDAERFVAISPLLMLPAVGDDRPPVVRSVEVEVVEEGPPTTRRIVVSAADVLRMNGVATEVFPHGVELLIDGQVQLQMSFDTFGVDPISGEWVTQGGVPVSEVVRPDGRLMLGEYAVVPGLTEIEVIVSDHRGNSTGRGISIPLDTAESP